MMRGHRESVHVVGHRSIKTLTVRGDRKDEIKGMPDEYRYYQRLTTNPRKQSGVQFNTHFSSHHRYRDKNAVVDYLNWGKEVGQAFMPHRNQRVAFDFHDSLHPTRLPHYAAREGWSEGQDPSSSLHGITAEFEPMGEPFCAPKHYNMGYTQHLPGQGVLRPTEQHISKSSALTFAQATMVGDEAEFGAEMEHGVFPGSVPGIHRPFLGEQDTMQMESMSRPKTGSKNQVTSNHGRFSKHIYINRPDAHNTLTHETMDHLSEVVDKYCFAPLSKMVVLKAAQSGKTDAFCAGVDLEEIAFALRMRNICLEEAKNLGNPVGPSVAGKQTDVARINALEQADRYQEQADDLLRKSMTLLWRIFSASNNLLTLINGRCHNVGNGVALLSKYPLLRDSTEFIQDGPSKGITPFGGLTHFLSRVETSLKYPGLAEYVILTEQPLYAGDALRLGWTDLFTALPDVDYHIKRWFDDTEHLHPDAVAWQVNHLLDTTMRMSRAHSSAMERCAISPTKAKWIEDAFADQQSLKAIIESLSEMECLSFDDPLNTYDGVHHAAGTLASVSEGVRKLRLTRITYTVAPNDRSTEHAQSLSTAEIFGRYFFASRPGASIVAHQDTSTTRERRAKEEEERQKLNPTSHRHVFVRLMGCEQMHCDFEYAFFSGGVSSTDTMLSQLKDKILKCFDFPSTRELHLLWQLPTLDTCLVRRDFELAELLSQDHGIEHPTKPTRVPPIYFTAVRTGYYMSEWAFNVKHQLLLSCPFALKAAFALLQSVRGEGDEGSICSVSETLAREYRYAVRLSKRSDFYNVGSWTQRPDDGSEDDRLPSTGEIFERNVQLGGHFFSIRPRWSPRTLEEVNDGEIAALETPLSYENDQTTEMHVPTETNMAARVVDKVFTTIGYELVPGLGEDESQPNLKSDAHVPTNVNFYVMARHPFKDEATSWRSHGFHEDSFEYFKREYESSVKAVYDPLNSGAHTYWSSEASKTKPDDNLLQDRLWNAVSEAEKNVDAWAIAARKEAIDGCKSYQVEITTPDEKIYDDHYYRWFIKPGHHPNPSGVRPR